MESVGLQVQPVGFMEALGSERSQAANKRNKVEQADKPGNTGNRELKRGEAGGHRSTENGEPAGGHSAAGLLSVTQSVGLKRRQL